MTHIGIIIGSTRPGRNGEQVARWVLQQAEQRTDATFELVDLQDFPLPHLDEPMSPMLGQYQHDHTKKWSAKIAGFDGFIMVTPEYNHSTSGALKNAIDYLFAEWNNKAVGFVSYGAVGGARAVEHLRLIVGELKLADVRTSVSLSMFHDFEGFTHFTPTEIQSTTLTTMIDELVDWSEALAPLRARQLATQQAS
ncbi:NAD(P)H-dependent oxidoreductase [Lentzea sp. PSKA42]|uniref:NAD(P)H-dependent oxidoreductase n=1 Tax=Lentzea indica TaxID=2604800 RepID=A0ABX1FN22_9PSEU|nr:NAD(P)H-dependent oxidoreductase [Lentzea indica]NKE60396.1 NAD(P)H-dependent oxidoreductase [Lentzea indica]